MPTTLTTTTIHDRQIRITFVRWVLYQMSQECNEIGSMYVSFDGHFHFHSQYSKTSGKTHTYPTMGFLKPSFLELMSMSFCRLGCGLSRYFMNWPVEYKVNYSTKYVYVKNRFDITKRQHISQFCISL